MVPLSIRLGVDPMVTRAPLTTEEWSEVFSKMQSSVAVAALNLPNVGEYIEQIEAQLDAMTKERDEAREAMRRNEDALLVKLGNITIERDAALARAEAGEEAFAKFIYECWQAKIIAGRAYPWVKGGNSLKQDEARRKARAAIDATGGTEG